MEDGVLVIFSEKLAKQSVNIFSKSHPVSYLSNFKPMQSGSLNFSIYVCKKSSPRYLYELLYPWLINCLHRADSLLAEHIENQDKEKAR